MKRFFIFVFFLLGIVSSSIGQDYYSYYPSSYYGKDYFVDISYNKSNNPTLYIGVESLDEKKYFVGLRVSEKAINQVISNLVGAKKLYTELKTNAKKNNIRSLSEKMSINSRVVVGYFKYRNKKYIDYSVMPKYSFVVERKDGRTEYLLRINTGRMISAIFEHIQCSSAEIVFSNEAEIDQFIDAISLK